MIEYIVFDENDNIVDVVEATSEIEAIRKCGGTVGNWSAEIAE